MKNTLRIAFGFLTSVITVYVLLVVGRYEDHRMEAREKGYRARNIEKGASLYYEHCRSCHGVNGEGSGELGPPLNDMTFFEGRLEEVKWQGTLEEYILSSIKNGRITSTRPGYVGDGNVVMNAWAKEFGGALRPDEIQALADYVLNWEATARGEFLPEELVLPTPITGSAVERSEVGKGYFLAAGCGDCHSVDGVSEGVSGPDLSHIGAVAVDRIDGIIAEVYLRESFLNPNAYIVEGFEPNQGCGGVLTSYQFDNLLIYLLSLK